MSTPHPRGNRRKKERTSPAGAWASPAWAPLAPPQSGTAGSPNRPPSLPNPQRAAFRSQVARWTQRIRVTPRQVRLQAMRRKWASCSSSGIVTFSLDLLTQPARLREYVIVHELLHLKVPNHGKLFKSLLRAYLPDYESIHPDTSPPGASSGRTL